MTFATNIETLKQDISLYYTCCEGSIPQDFQLFCQLYKKGRKLVSCIPGISTHAETVQLSPFVDWEKILNQ